MTSWEVTSIIVTILLEEEEMGVKRSLLALLLLVLVACTAGCRNARPSRPMPVPPSPDLTLLGTVAEVSPNARLIVLAEPPSG